MLVSTTVIEGQDVDHVADASVMVVEHAERFGLARLHPAARTRGPTRRRKKAIAVLMTGERISDLGEERLNAMVSTQGRLRIGRA